MLTEYSRLTTDQLYLLFCENSWRNLSDAQCIAALQELENRVAAREGRPPMEVQIMPKESERPGLNGYYVDGRNALFISRRYVANRKSVMFGVTAGEAINNVLHEGRHAYQYEAIRGHIKGVARSTVLKWGINVTDYHSGGGFVGNAMYFAQPIEMDARHFARRELQAISSRITKLTGSVDRGFMVALNRDKVQENAKCAMIKQHLDSEILEKMEGQARLRYRLTHPGVDLKGVEIFPEARWLKKKDADVEGLDMYLDELDEMSDEDEVADEEPDAFEKLVEMLRKEKEAASRRADKPDEGERPSRPDGAKIKGF